LWTQGAVGSTYYYRGTTFDNLIPHQISNGMPVPVLTPSGSGFDRDYAGSGGVMRGANGTDLLMFYHAENSACGSDKPPVVGVGLARSSDGGATWTRLGQVISSPEMPTDCNYSDFKGAGNPTVLISRDGQYIYMYYMEWLSTRPDSISLARAPISSDGVPGSWLKYKNGSLSEAGLGGASDPVIQRANETAVYAGVPNVTFNLYLNLYLAIVVGQNGFYYVSSSDGIDWNTPRLFWEVPPVTVLDSLNDGDHWYYYPTLISLDQDTDDTTLHTAYLYYARGTRNGPPHSTFRRPVGIGYEVYLPKIIKGLSYCTGLDWQEPCRVVPNRFVIGDITIDDIRQYDLGTGEGTVAFFEKESTVYAQWGAAYYVGSIDIADQFIQGEFANGCATGCGTVRFVIVRSNGQQEALCYYPDGTTRALQSSGTETWCPSYQNLRRPRQPGCPSPRPSS